MTSSPILPAGIDQILGSPSNGAAPMIDLAAPYSVQVTLRGSAPLLFHAWNDDAVAEKASAAKGSKAKKTDDVESYIYRTTEGIIAIPGVYLIGSMIDPRNGAAKYRQDPRSPRKSALDLFRAGVVAATVLAPITSAAGQSAETWDYLDRRRVMIQRSAITRVRPAFMEGWAAEFVLTVLTPEYIPESLLLDVLTQAGRLVGIGDFRPTFGRFAVTNYQRLED